MNKVGVIGLGTMGGPMALNLLKAGFEVRGFNRTAARAQALTSAGGIACSTVADVVRGSETVMLMLSNDAAVSEVVLGADGIAAWGKAGLIVLDSSTVAPWTSREMADALANRGIQYLDAP